MNVSLMISRRMRLSDNGRGPSRSGVVIAVAGISLALTVMMLSVAVVIGFKSAISAKVEGFEASLTVIPLDGGDKVVTDSMQSAEKVVAEALKGYSPRPEVAAVYDRPGVLKTDTDFLGVVFRAYGPEHDYGFEESNLAEGKLPEKPTEIALSRDQAAKLGVKTGDRIFSHFISGEAVRTRRFTVSGIYASNFGEYDQSIVYATEKALRGIKDIGNDWIEVRNIPDGMIQTAADDLQYLLNMKYGNGELEKPLAVRTLWQRGAMYYNWLDMLDTNVIVILVLMGCVSGFTLISSLLILILERVRMIGILKSLGATNRQVRGVFLWLGARIVGIGLLIGNAVALSLIYAEKYLHFIPLDPKAYYLDYVPVSLSVGDFLLLNGGIFAACVILMLVPTAIISRISPASVMRYE